MLNELITRPSSSWIEAVGNLVFLDASDYDYGASWYYSYAGNGNGYYTANDPKPYYTPIHMRDGSRVTLGNTANGGVVNDGQDYNLRVDGHNIQGATSTVYFEGTGEFDFSPVTGAGKLNRVDEIAPQSQIIRTSNVATTIGSWIKYNNSIIPGSQDVSSFGVRSTGAMTVVSDMSAVFKTSSQLTMIPFGDQTSNPPSPYVDSCSNNTANAAAFRVGSMKIDNNFTGSLVSDNDNFKVKNFNTAAMNGNVVGAYGIWSDGAVSIAGVFGGSIHTQANGTNLVNNYLVDPETGYDPVTGITHPDPSQFVKDANVAKNASVNNNKVNSIGIKGTDIVFNEFAAAEAGTPSIHTEVDGVRFVATSVGGDGSSSSVTGNDITSVAIDGTNVTFNGKFLGHLDGVISDIAVGEFGGNSHTWRGNSYNLYGIRASGSITANSNFDGAITLKVNAPDNSMQDSVVDSNVYGMYATSITVANGYLRSDITITVNDDLRCSSSEDYICGVRADMITAAAFDGTITVTNNRTSTVGVGLLGMNSFENGNDGSFDVTGDIFVMRSGLARAVGIMGSTGKDMNIRISGNVISNQYAVFAGRYHSGDVGITRYNTDDRVEVAAGAYVVGAIQLYNGQNSTVIDSNARVEGDLNARFGTNNVEFMLNDFAMDGVGVVSGLEDQAILVSNVNLDSSVHFTVNLNNVDLSKGKREFKLYSGDMKGWDSRIINFKYQGISGRIDAKGGSYEQDGFRIYCDINSNNEVVFTVEELPPDTSVLSQLGGLTQTFDKDAGTVTLGWSTTGGQGSYEVEYRIIGGNSSGKTIVQYVSGNKNSITLSNIEAGQTVEWRVRQNIGSGDRTSVWSDGKDVAMVDHTYVYDKVQNPDFELGTSSQSAVSRLNWEPGDEYSEGLKGYVVRYFQKKEYQSGTIDWDNVAYMEKFVTSPTLLVTGLNNLEYFYWQVQAVDRVDSNGNWILSDENWVDGQIFKVYDDDTTAPWFLNGEEAVSEGVAWVRPADITDTHTMNPTLTWESAIDDRSGVSRYTIRFRKEGETEWKSIDIPVTDQSKTSYSFNLAQWIKENPWAGYSLLENGTYEWELRAVDYVGNESEALKGKWVGDNTAPALRAADVTVSSSWAGGSNKDTVLTVTVNWKAAEEEQGGSGLLRYELQYRLAGSEGDWTKVVISVTDDLSWSGRLANGDWEYQLNAFDVAGNKSTTVTGTWLGDNVAPEFTDATAIKAENEYDLASKTNTLVFNWSTALDNSTTRPNSGVEKYVISFTDKQGKLHTYEAGANQTSLTLTVGKGMQLRDLEDGSYSWDVTVYDKAGNSTTVNGGEFLIDTTAPQGSFTGIPTFHGEVTYTTSTESSTGGRIPGFGSPPSESGETTVVETVTDVWVEFSFPGNFTDNSSGVQYVVQVSNNAKFTGDRTYEFVTSEQTLRLDSTNGFGVGSLAQNKEVYWRVQAMDSMGNRTGLWTQGEGFYFIGDQMTSYIRDVTIPTNIESTSTITVKGNQVELGWSASYDLFGVEWYEIRYTAKGGKAMTVRVSAVDVSTVLTIKDDGEYSWSVRAVDYVGNTSEWTKGSSFIVDMTAPAIIRDFTVTSAEASKDISFSWSVPYDAMGVAGYIITIRKAVGTGYTTQYHYISDPKATNVTLYNQEDGDYWFSIQAYDKAGNLSGSSSEKYVYVDASADAGNDFNTATQLAWGTSEKQSVGGTDVKDVFKVTLDGAAQLAISIRNVLNLGGKNSGVKVTIYNSDLKKLKSYTVKPGSQDLPLLLCDVAAGRDYYIEVVSADKKTSAKYEISADQQLFPAKTGNDSFETAKQATITLDGKGSGSFRNGWVGFGDAVDFYYIDAAAAGSMTVSLSNVTAKLKVTLYNEQGKKLKSVTVSGDKAVFENLLVPGAAYLSVESGDKGKGKQNSYYDISISDKYFPTETVANNSFEEAYRNNRVDLSSGSAKVSDWVGYGDAVDYYYLGASGPGEMTVTLSNVTAKLKVTLYDEQGKKLKSVTVSGDKTAFENLLVPGAAYLSVESGDKGKGKQNSYYDITINDKYFPTESVANNSFAEAEEIKLSTTVNTSISGWVGYQDGYDYYKLMATGPGSFSISINGVDPDKKLKVSLYDANQKKIKTWSVKGSDMLFFDKELLTGQTYLVVESGDKGKGKQNSDYSISVAVNEYFPKGDTGNNELAAARTVNFDSATGTAALSNEWVGYGDAKDFFAFELDSASKVDLDLNYYNKDLRFGKDVKINLYDMATGKKIKLDDALTSVDILEANTKYAVSVEIANEKKHWTGYDLAISKLA